MGQMSMLEAMVLGFIREVSTLHKTDVGVGKGVSVNTSPKGEGRHVEVGKKGGIGVSTGKQGQHTGVGVGKGGVSVNTGHKGKPVYVGVKPGSSPFIYQDQLHHNPNVALFFLEKDLRTGTKMNLHFFKKCRCSYFLASSNSRCHTIFISLFSVQPGVKKMASDEAVVCHKQGYAYAVFYCHTSQTTRAYTVPMLGDDGTKAKAVAICHTDTSAWNPKHLAFQVIKVKPGSVPICHFLPEDHVVWNRN